MNENRRKTDGKIDRKAMHLGVDFWKAKLFRSHEKSKKKSSYLRDSQLKGT